MRTMLFFASIITLLLAIFSPLSVADTLRFERISAEQGLSQMSVNAALQDSEGFMWFGTQDGLNRYDGYQFKVYRYDRNDPHSMVNNWVNVLFEDSVGNLWVGTNGGLLKFDRKADHFIRYVHDANDPQTISGNSVWSIDEDQQGHLWIGVYRDGVSRYDRQTNQFTRYTHDATNPNSLSDNRVIDVLVDHANTVWVGTNGGGLNRFNRDGGQSDQFNHFVHQEDASSANPKNGLINNRVIALYEDNEHRLWVGTTEGLNYFNPNDNTFSVYPLNLQANGGNNGVQADTAVKPFIREMVGDSKSNLWIATMNNGLVKFNPQTGHSIVLKHDPLDPFSLSSTKVRAIVEDRSGIMWLGTRVGGINKYNPATAHFAHFNHKSNQNNSLKDNTIWALYEDNEGQTWIGSGFNGVSRYNPKTRLFVHYQHKEDDPDSINGKTVLAIFQDHAGVMWFGTQGGELARFDLTTQKFSHFTHEPSNPASIVKNGRLGAIIEDRGHFLWLATDNGLARLDPSRQHFTHFQHDPDINNSISSNRVMSLFEDAQGFIWAGTFKHGLNRLDKSTGQFTRYRHDPDNRNTLGSDAVNAIYQDDDGFLWFGTSAGLDKFDLSTNTFTHYGRQQGLSNETVMGVMGDQRGYLWLTTNEGLNRFDSRTELFNVYKFSDGIQGNEFSTGAYFTTLSGRLLVGGINGFNAFYPQHIQDDLTPPSMVLTHFWLNNKDVKIAGEPLDGETQHDNRGSGSSLAVDINQTDAVVLSHTDSVFTFEFAALHFASPKQNHYAYKLEGFDRQWVDTDAQNRRATYTNLDAGKYVFKVRGSNSDNIWSHQVKVINVTVLPAPWRTWWARTLYFMVAAAIIFTLLHLRFKRREAEQQVLTAERQAATVTEASELQLSLALWGSGDQLWDWDKTQGVIQRKNILSQFSFAQSQALTELEEMAPMVHPDDQAKFTATLAAHCQGDRDHFECAYRMKDSHGQWRWVLDRGRIVATDDKGNILRISGTTQDIHSMRQDKEALKELNETLEQKVHKRTQALQDSIDQLKAAQKQLIEAEKMAALGNLVAGVAHEVNTPLGICITMVSLNIEQLNQLSQQISEGTITRKLLQAYVDNTKQGQALVDSNLHRAAELVQSFKKVAVEQTADSFDEIVFHDYLTDIINSIEPRLTDTDISIKLISQGDWWLKTWPGAWWQVISNLVENSLSHGFLNKTAGEITIEARLEQDRLHFVYRDNGNGMNALELGNMYEPFYTTARSRGGTGLGMHVVFNLVVQKLGGEINCYSEPDKGVEFEIDIPR
ncbi:MAG: ligand-binding sensor domain-containing protein/signal transduction histidine kinase [Phenylobacterium sp.]|jgi:ligand-binding sensor domain-containing protein/signal transduction histidine kinase